MPGSICYKGQKQAKDHCDYNFECLSRCCSDNICSPVIGCVATCKANADCASEPCCSFGYCTGSVSICEQGMKADFDTCEAATECTSGRCTNGRCTSNEVRVSDNLSMNLMIVLVFLMLLIVITTCYFAKVKADQVEALSNYNRHRPGSSSGEIDETERTERRRRRQRSRRSGSSDSEGRQRRGSSRGHSESPGRNQLVERNATRSRGLSDSNGQSSQEKLSKENLERLSRQANSVKVPSVNKYSSEKREASRPALLFVEDEREILNQYGSSFVTTNRGSD